MNAGLCYYHDAFIFFPSQTLKDGKHKSHVDEVMSMTLKPADSPPTATAHRHYVLRPAAYV